MEFTDGLMGSLIGAGAALIAQFAGQWHTRKTQREQWHIEQVHKIFEARRDAYVEWLQVVDQVCGHATKFKAAADNGLHEGTLLLDKEDLDGTRHNVLFNAAKVLLLEPEAVAQKKVRAAISTYYDAMQVMFDPTATKELRARSLTRISTAFDELADWLTERFARVPQTELRHPPAPTKRR